MTRIAQKPRKIANGKPTTTTNKVPHTAQYEEKSTIIRILTCHFSRKVGEKSASDAPDDAPAADDLCTTTTTMATVVASPIRESVRRHLPGTGYRYPEFDGAREHTTERISIGSTCRVLIWVGIWQKMCYFRHPVSRSQFAGASDCIDDALIRRRLCWLGDYVGWCGWNFAEYYIIDEIEFSIENSGR